MSTFQQKKKKKKNCELDGVLTRTVNILTTNELVKLTMIWTTGPSLLTILTKIKKKTYWQQWTWPNTKMEESTSETQGWKGQFWFCSSYI